MCQVFSGYGQELGPILSTIQQKLRSDRLIQLRIGFLESQHFPVCIWKALGRCCGNVWACLNFDRIWSFAFWGDHFLSPESPKKEKKHGKGSKARIRTTPASPNPTHTQPGPGKDRPAADSRRDSSGFLALSGFAGKGNRNTPTLSRLNQRSWNTS